MQNTWNFYIYENIVNISREYIYIYIYTHYVKVIIVLRTIKVLIKFLLSLLNL